MNAAHEITKLLRERGEIDQTPFPTTQRDVDELGDIFDELLAMGEELRSCALKFRREPRAAAVMMDNAGKTNDLAQRILAVREMLQAQEKPEFKDVVDATLESFSDGGVEELPDPSSEITPQDEDNLPKKKKLIPATAQRRRFFRRR